MGVCFVLRTGQIIIAVLGLLAMATASQADMTNVGWSDVGLAAPLASAAPAAGLDGTLLPAASSVEQQVFLLSGGEAAAGQVLELPSGPDSSGLFLSALGTLGAWQLGRAAKKLHLGHLPEWYHAEGPAQVGHVRVAELDFDGTIAWDRGDAVLLPDEHAASRLLWVEPPPRLSALDYLTSAAPRGPPLLAA
jgi:hypothetical protein